jgi:hypothetical protein
MLPTFAVLVDVTEGQANFFRIRLYFATWPADRGVGPCGEEATMAEVIQGVFPGGEGPDGALPGVSAVAALNLSPEIRRATSSWPKER